jgi:hypothetical protein
MMYLFLKAEPSPEAPYQLLFITVTESRGGWVSLYHGELQQNGWRPYHPAVAGLNRSSYGAALEAFQR